MSIIEKRLLDLLENGNGEQREFSAKMLRWLTYPSAIPLLANALYDRHHGVRENAFHTLQQYKVLPTWVTEKLNDAKRRKEYSRHYRFLMVDESQECRSNLWIGDFLAIFPYHIDDFEWNIFDGYIAGTTIRITANLSFREQGEQYREEWEARYRTFPRLLRVSDGGLEEFYRFTAVNSMDLFYSYPPEEKHREKLFPYTCLVTEPNLPVHQLSVIVQLQWKNWNDSPDVRATFAHSFLEIDGNEPIHDAKNARRRIQSGDPQACVLSPGTGDLLPFDQNQRGEILQGFVRLLEHIGDSVYRAILLYVERATTPAVGDVLVRSSSIAFNSTDRGRDFCEIRADVVRIIEVIAEADSFDELYLNEEPSPAKT